MAVAHCGGCWWLQRTWLGIGQSALRACVQCQGLWAWWTVDVEGAGGALRLLLQSHTVEVVIGWWCASVGDRAIGVARLCAMPGPFDPVDREGDGVQLVALDHHRVVVASCGCGHWWVAAWSFHAISIAHFCATLGFPWMQGVSRQGRMPHEHGGGWRTFTPLHRCWTVN